MTQPPDMKVRLSSVLRRQVEEAARANNRTLNSEIVFRLEQSFESGARSVPSGDHEKRIGDLEKGHSALLGSLVDLGQQLELIKDQAPGRGSSHNN